MMYGRSLGKALELFHLDPERWHELAANRAVWRSMLKMGMRASLVRSNGLPTTATLSPSSTSGAHEAVARLRCEDDGSNRWDAHERRSAPSNPKAHQDQLMMPHLMAAQFARQRKTRTCTSLLDLVL